MASIPVEHITLSYTCSEDETEASQPLADITSAGTLICPECGDDMVLDTTADVIMPPLELAPLEELAVRKGMNPEKIQVYLDKAAEMGAEFARTLKRNGGERIDHPITPARFPGYPTPLQVVVGVILRSESVATRYGSGGAADVADEITIAWENGYNDVWAHEG